MDTDRRSSRRARGKSWLVVVGLVVAVGSFLGAWRTLSLDGLPDVGEPFDSKSFYGPPIPDSENAFVLYKVAVARLGKEPYDFKTDWISAGPIDRRWLEECRPAMEVWRRGTERPRARYIEVKDLTFDTQLPVIQDLRQFMRLAKLEGSRLMAEGDVEGAWGWYRAIHRTGGHLGQKATLIERLVGIAFHNVATSQLIPWASDPRVTPAMLRRALDAAIADHAMYGPLSDNLKVEYLSFVQTSDNPDLILKCLNDNDLATASFFTRAGRNPSVFRLQRVLLKEPERSKRVLQMVFANLLAWADLPVNRRPPVDGSIPNHTPGSTVTVLMDLRKLDDSAPFGARALPADQVVRWFESTLYARQLMVGFTSIDTAFQRERATQANLLMTLATQLYEREHGKPPETTEELVGPYLKALPEGYKKPTETAQEGRKTP